MTTTAPHAEPARLAAVELIQLIEGLDRSCDAELEAVARLAAAVLRAPVASVDVVDGEWVHQLAVVGTGRRAPRRDAACVRRVRGGHPGPVASAALSAPPDSADSPEDDGRGPAFRGHASAPLEVGGVVVGALCVLDPAVHEFSAADLAALADLALLAGAVLQRRAQARAAARLAGDAEQARQELERTVAELGGAHAELSRAQAYTSALLEVLPVGVVAVDAAGERVLVNGVTRRWHDEGTGERSTLASAPAGAFTHLDGTPMAREELPLIRSLHGSGIARTECWIAYPGSAPRRLSITSSPIQDANGELIGSVAAMTDVTRQCQLEEQLRAAAMHDALTGLPNRALLVDRLEHALRASRRSEAPVAVLFCDLDGFKAVNDTFGHAAGDEVLVEVARRLSSVLRPGDTVGRLGGDEFVLLCPGVPHPEAAAAVATRVEQVLRAPVRLHGGGTASVGVSVGTAVSGGGETPEELLTRADQGMYTVKQQHHDALA